MATSPNFNWPEPDNTDLVKNGALAIRTAVNAIDTSLVDLKGGTTGQVLAKATGTDMDFTWSTPATAAGFATNGTINGAMDVWQRGTSFTATGKTFTADRWWKFRGGDAAGATYSRQNSAVSAAGTQYCQRIQRDSGNTSTATMQLYSDFETSNSIIYAGQAIAVSFYARKGANYSGGDFNLTLQTGTGTDQSQFSGFTSETTVLTVTATSASMNTTTFVRYSGTVTLASTVTQIGLKAIWTPTGTAGAADFVEITGVQVEKGATATTFNRSSGTIQGELAACQRYFYSWNTANANDANGNICYLAANTSVAVYGTLQYPVTMRTSPSFTSTAASGFQYYMGSARVLSALSQPRASIYASMLNGTVTGATVGQAGWLEANNNTGYLWFSAEL